MSVAVIDRSTRCQLLLSHMIGSMSRWEPNARGRLEQAALELYSERGFEQTTVAEIAKRAGLTERTFFRYFADKREVLFAGAGSLQEFFVSTLTDAPDSAAPIDAVAATLEAVAALFQERRGHSRQRQAVIAANPELQERELIKLASLSAALADGLRRRGVTDPAASLAAEAGTAVFKIAFERWIDETNQQDLAQLIRESLDQLKAVTAGK
jgi:AcrR family transcriptional regulator